MAMTIKEMNMMMMTRTTMERVPIEEARMDDPVGTLSPTRGGNTCSSSSRSSGSSSSTSSTSSTTLLAHSGDLPPATVFRLTINSRPYVKSPKRTPSVFLPS